MLPITKMAQLVRDDVINAMHGSLHKIGVEENCSGDATASPPAPHPPNPQFRLINSVSSREFDASTQTTLENLSRAFFIPRIHKRLDARVVSASRSDEQIAA